MASSFLHVSPIRPRAHGNGLAMRTSLFTDALARIGHTEVVVAGDASPASCPVESGAAALRELDTGGQEHRMLRLVGTIRDPAERATALRAMGRPFASRMVSAPAVSAFADMLGERTWGGVVLSRAYLLPLLDAMPGAPDVPVVVDLDDDDGDLARQRAALARKDGDHDRADWFEAEADTHDMLIGRSARAVALFTAASDQAAAAIRERLGIDNVVALANGVAMPAHTHVPADGAPLLFVGNLAYAPNVEGLIWFLDYVWPCIRAQRPSVRLVIAGSNPAEALRRRCEGAGIDLVADPADIAPLYRSAAASIVPLLAGSGSRIKILEAGAHGVPVVSTHRGAAGLALDPERHLFASKAVPEDFARACLACLHDRGEAQARARVLRGLVGAHHDREKIVAALEPLLRRTFDAR